jgi:hypothetical protein
MPNTESATQIQRVGPVAVLVEALDISITGFASGRSSLIHRHSQQKAVFNFG